MIGCSHKSFPQRSMIEYVVDCGEHLIVLFGTTEKGEAADIVDQDGGVSASCWIPTSAAIGRIAAVARLYFPEERPGSCPLGVKRENSAWDGYGPRLER